MGRWIEVERFSFPSRNYNHVYNSQVNPCQAHSNHDIQQSSYMPGKDAIPTVCVPYTIKVLFRATRVPYDFAEMRPICMRPADSAAHLLPCIGSFLNYSQGKPTGLVSCRRLGTTEPQERNHIDRYIETNVITGHQRRNTGAIIKTDTWPKLMRSNKAFFPFPLAQPRLVTRSTGRGTVGTVSSVRAVNSVRNLTSQGLAGVSGVRLAGVDDREDRTLPVVAVANRLVDGSGSLGVRLLGPLRVDVLDDRVVGVCNVTTMN